MNCSVDDDDDDYDDGVDMDQSSMVLKEMQSINESVNHASLSLDRVTRVIAIVFLNHTLQ